jgi:hypothetical protein
MTDDKVIQESGDKVIEGSGDKLVESLPQQPAAPKARPPELSPTRYGDWEINGKCIDF